MQRGLRGHGNVTQRLVCMVLLLASFDSNKQKQKHVFREHTTPQGTRRHAIYKACGQIRFAVGWAPWMLSEMPSALEVVTWWLGFF